MEYKSEIAQKLKKILESQSQEQIDEDWAAIVALGLTGPKISEIIDCSEENNYVYSFKYNPCHYESVSGTVSIHFSEEGAIEAMEKHKEEKLKEHIERYGEDWYEYTRFGEYENWFIEKTEILD